MSPRHALRRRTLQRAGAALGFTLALLALAPPAQAAGGLEISPSRIDVAARRGDRLPPITLTNGSNRPVVVTLTHAAVGQALTGLPLPDPADRAFLRIVPAKLELGAHERRTVRATVTGGPTRGIGAYGTIVATTEPAARSGAAVVAKRLRLSGTVLLRFPGRMAVRGRATALRFAQGAPRVLKAFARIRNTGNIHTRPLARLTIRDSTGSVVERMAVPTGNVIPGAERELTGQITHVLPAGTYSARLDVRLGRHRSSRSTEFTLVGPNELPTSKLRIAGLTTPHPEAGKPVESTVTVRNTGTAPITPDGLASLAPAGGGPSTAQTRLSIGTVMPGATVQRQITLPAIRSGDHQLSVQFLDGDRVIAQRTTTFALVTSRPVKDRLMDWIAAHLPLVLGGLLLLFGLFAVAVLVRLHQLKRGLRTAAAAPVDR